MITLTQAAAGKIKAMAESENFRQTYPPESGINCLRIKVKGGGCSGFMYELVWDKEKPGDQATEAFGAKLVCDSKSFLFLNGAEIDYVDGLMGAGFSLKNPNAKGTCGCGQSFNA